MTSLDTPSPLEGHGLALPPAACALKGLLPSAARPVIVDIGCGKGRSLRGRAAALPEAWFIGVDRMVSRLRRLAKRAGREGLFNIHLWHGEAHTALVYGFPANSITECTIFFPDPWPKRRHHRRRLITPAFLDTLEQKLIPGGRVYLATDDAGYFQWITDTFARCHAFHSCPPLILPSDQQTDFEVMFHAMHHAIYRCGYRRKVTPSRKAS